MRNEPNGIYLYTPMKIREFIPDKDCDYETIAEYDSNNYNNEDDEYGDSWEWAQEEFIERINEEIEFPVNLEAAASNWQGQTGYAEADNAEQLFDKCMSFDNNTIYLRLNSDGYYIRTGSHDVPQGFNIYITNKEESDEN
jgi:hypothetical protein